MKKTSSFHLEESTLELILNYQKENKLSSRNIALEHMLVEYQILKNFTFELPRKQTIKEEIIEEKKLTKKGKKIKSVYDSMED